MHFGLNAFLFNALIKQLMLMPMLFKFSNAAHLWIKDIVNFILGKYIFI